jgi:hypothetical protein
MMAPNATRSVAIRAFDENKGEVADTGHDDDEWVE